jgi:hypothetical protein
LALIVVTGFCILWKETKLTRTPAMRCIIEFAAIGIYPPIEPVRLTTNPRQLWRKTIHLRAVQHISAARVFLFRGTMFYV